MSLYDMVMPANPFASMWIGLLGKKPSDFGRIRDAWLQDDGDHGLRIVVLTRNGGGNREAHEEVFAELRMHPLYLRDRDDDFDSTYALIEFRFPEAADPGEMLKALDDQGVRDKVIDNRTLRERFEAAMASITGND